MKKIILAIFLCITAIGTNNFCMENKLSGNSIDLKNPALMGQNLERFLAIEASGKFSLRLLNTEVLLNSLFDSQSLSALQKMWGEETYTLALRVSQRPHQRDRLFSIINNKDDSHELETIIKCNPCMLNAYNSEQINLLHKATLLERKNCLKQLLLLKANPNCVDSKGCSPLHIAIEYDRSFDIIESLLAAGAKPDLSNKNGKTPFDMACEKHSPNVEAFEKYGYLFFSARWPYKNPFELLKDGGIYLKELANQPLGSLEWELAKTALHKLFRHIDMNNSSSQEGGIVTNAHGYALFYASREQCDQLLGAESITHALTIIAEKRAINEMLLLSAANTKFNNKDLERVLKKYLVSSALQYDILKICIDNNNMICLFICLNNGFNPNRYHKGISLLHYAVDHNKLAALELLATKRNTDLVPLNDQGRTPLDHAIFKDNEQCISVIAKAINERINNLMFNKNYYCGTYYCGLVKHINIECDCALTLAQELIDHGFDTK